MSEVLACPNSKQNEEKIEVDRAKMDTSVCLVQENSINGRDQNLSDSSVDVNNVGQIVSEIIKRSKGNGKTHIKIEIEINHD